MKEWIRPRDVCETYGIGKTRAHELLKQFRAETDSKNYIKDSGILIVKKAEFEEWWRTRHANSKHKVG